MHGFLFILLLLLAAVVSAIIVSLEDKYSNKNKD